MYDNTYFRMYSRSCKRQTRLALVAWTAILVGCGSGIHNAAPGTNAPAATSHAVSPFVITHGGTYSGSWTSNDPAVPAVAVETDEPVVIENSTITGRGDLIRITGTAGAHVTLQNISATGLDPHTAGQQRGAFVRALTMASLSVEHCSMMGTRDGIVVETSQPRSLLIRNNSAMNLEDRASDGAGGFQNARPDLGHFVLLRAVSAINGAEISWNQVIQTMGQSSTEDGIDLYNSQGTATSPVDIHDNYFDGASSPAASAYSGSGLLADGDSMEPVSAYAVFEDNQVVHTQGGGVMIAGGHDILARGNRVVSCGQNGDGSWYALTQVTAVSLWNFYGAPSFFNNTITATGGGLVVPGPDGTPATSDIYANPTDIAQGNTVAGNHFTDPCLTAAGLNRSAESAERAAWTQKLNASGNSPGNLTP